MTSAPARQFRVEMPDGVVVERLPVGVAHGRWRLAFVFHGYDLSRAPGGAMDFQRGLNGRIALGAVDWELEERDRGWGGGDRSHGYRTQLLDNGVTRVRITYSHEGETVATEVVRLVRRDQMTLALPDGVVVDRLPVGLANGVWHLGFVWSGHDPSPAPDSAPFVGFGPTAERLLRVSGVGGDLEQVGASGSGGGGEHERWIEYRETGLAGLHVSYGEPDRPVATETIDLGQSGSVDLPR